MVFEVDKENYRECIGKYGIFFHDGIDKFVAKIRDIVEQDDKLVMRLYVLTGPSKDTYKKGIFVKDRKSEVFDEDSLVEAMLKI